MCLIKHRAVITFLVYLDLLATIIQQCLRDKLLGVSNISFIGLTVYLSLLLVKSEEKNYFNYFFLFVNFVNKSFKKNPLSIEMYVMHTIVFSQNCVTTIITYSQEPIIYSNQYIVYFTIITLTKSNFKTWINPLDLVVAYYYNYSEQSTTRIWPNK